MHVNDTIIQENFKEVATAVELPVMNIGDELTALSDAHKILRVAKRTRS